MVGILGPNGAGKTTLLRILSGILEPSMGTVYIGSVAIGRLKRYLARWVGYLPQDFGLPKNLTAREYLDYYDANLDVVLGHVEDHVILGQGQRSVVRRADLRLHDGLRVEVVEEVIAHRHARLDRRHHLAEHQR